MRKEPQTAPELTFGPSEKPPEMCCGIILTETKRGSGYPLLLSYTLVTPHTTQEIPTGLYREAPRVIVLKRLLEQGWQ